MYDARGGNPQELSVNFKVNAESSFEADGTGSLEDGLSMNTVNYDDLEIKFQLLGAIESISSCDGADGSDGAD